MKLTKRGVDPKQAIRHTNCGNCKSEYEFTASDPEVKLHYDQRDGDFFSFKCEVCGGTINTSAHNPPGRQ